LGGSKLDELVGVIRKIVLVVKEIWLAKGEFVNRAGAPAANDFTFAAKLQFSRTDTRPNGRPIHNRVNKEHIGKITPE
jgi:hypothetical protein